LFGTIQETAGIVPAFAAARNASSFWMLPSWPSSWTVVKPGSGFQIEGTPTICVFGAQVIAPVSQSGCAPSSR